MERLDPPPMPPRAAVNPYLAALRWIAIVGLAGAALSLFIAASVDYDKIAALNAVGPFALFSIVVGTISLFVWLAIRAATWRAPS